MKSTTRQNNNCQGGEMHALFLLLLPGIVLVAELVSPGVSRGMGKIVLEITKTLVGDEWAKVVLTWVIMAVIAISVISLTKNFLFSRLDGIPEIPKIEFKQ